MLKKLLACTVASSVLIGAAHALPPPVAVCYNLSPFIDVLKLTRQGFQVGHKLLVGNWLASPFYALPVSGAFEFEAGTTTPKVGLVGSNNAGGIGAFGGNQICSLTGIPNGPWTLQCSGGPGANFANSGNSLTPVSCAGLPDSFGSGSPAGMPAN